MGLFTTLLTLPLAPVRGVVWVAEQVTEEADRQLYDEDRIRSELLQLEIDAEEGKLGEEERRRMEDDLFDRLAAAQERKAARQYDQASPDDAYIAGDQPEEYFPAEPREG
ncbi:MAG: gas vesicle protein GvpG [Solirubrobacterales bacterium]|nr:gas vesicle protein GvpG [Solirubrobacterales bacterium]